MRVPFALRRSVVRGGHLVGLRRHDQAVHPLQAPALTDELGRKPVQQFGVSGGHAGPPEITGCGDDADPKVMMPEAVDHHPRGQRVLRAGNPSGQFCAGPGSSLRQFRSPVREQHTERPHAYAVAFGGVIAASQQVDGKTLGEETADRGVEHVEPQPRNRRVGGAQGVEPHAGEQRQRDQALRDVRAHPLGAAPHGDPGRHRRAHPERPQHGDEHERAGDARRRIELRTGERCAVADRRRVRPVDDRHDDAGQDVDQHRLGRRRSRGEAAWDGHSADSTRRRCRADDDPRASPGHSRRLE